MNPAGLMSARTNQSYSALETIKLAQSKVGRPVLGIWQVGEYTVPNRLCDLPVEGRRVSLSEALRQAAGRVACGAAG